MVFIILMTTQVIVFCLMLFVYLRSRLHGGSDKGFEAQWNEN
ncbi:hypothetical protein ACF1CY_003825 [Providencia rettgeri]